MIHFQCRCGTTLSAEESATGGTVRCVSCGNDLTVPAGGTAKKLRPNGKRESGTHDFDAEITAAARSAPARPRKTPRKVETPPSDTASPGGVGEAPAYDLIAVEAWASRLGVLSWLTLLGFAAGAGAAYELLRGDVVPRAVAAGILLLTGVLGHMSLRILRDVCRATVGLAQRQREMADSMHRD